MILSILYFLPLFTCLTWLVMFKFRKKNVSQKILMEVTALSSFYFLTFAFYISPNTNYVWMCRLDYVNEFVILFLLAAIVSYVYFYWKGRVMSKTIRLLISLPAIIHGAIVTLLQMMVGIDRSSTIYKVVDTQLSGPGDAFQYSFMRPFLDNEVEVLYWLFCMVIINMLAFLYLVGVMVICCLALRKLNFKFRTLAQFLFKGQRSTPARVIIVSVIIICMLLSCIAVIGRSFIYNTPWLGITLCLLVTQHVFWLEYVEYCNHMQTISLHDLLHMDFMVGRRENPVHDTTETPPLPPPIAPSVEGMAEEKAVEEKKVPVSVDIETRSILDTKLRKVMEEDKLYKDSALTRDMLASILGTNRTTLSSYINNMYGMSFNAYLVKLRIEAAKAYMKKNPAATLDEVAIECGFKDTTTFCHKFKDIEGVTAKGWLFKKDK